MIEDNGDPYNPCSAAYIGEQADEAADAQPDLIITYTDAPDSYDGFGTRTELPNVGIGPRGPVRCVLTQEAHVEWQRKRYDSGMYISASQEEFARLTSGKYPLVRFA